MESFNNDHWIQKNLINIAKQIGKLGIDGVQLKKTGRRGIIDTSYLGVLDCHMPADLGDVRVVFEKANVVEHNKLLQYAMEDLMDMYFGVDAWYGGTGGVRSLEIQASGTYIFDSWKFKETQHQDRRLSGDILVDELFPPKHSL